MPNRTVVFVIIGILLILTFFFLSFYSNELKNYKKAELKNDDDLWNAAENDDIYRILLIIKDHPDFINARELVMGRTPLHIAALSGKYSSVDLLFALGADPNSRDLKTGGTPLYWAVLTGQKDIVRLLVSKGVNLDIRDYNGVSPLKLALDGNKSDIAEIIGNNGGKL